MSTVTVQTRTLSVWGDLTEEQYREAARCQESFRHFLRYWQFTNRETGEILSFEHPWPGQSDLVDEIEAHPWLFALKAGKLGFTELECAYDGWVCRFGQPNARVHVFSRDATAAEELLDYIRFGLNHLPDWMRLPGYAGRGADTDVSLRYQGFGDDVRTVVRYAAGPNVSIDQTATHSHVDEMARMPFTEKTWTAIETTIAPGGSVHIVTRGAGAGNYSATLWRKAMTGESRLYPFFAPWDRRPDRDEEWYEQQKGEHTDIGLAEFAPRTWEEAIAGPQTASLIPLEWVEAAFRRHT